MAIVALLVAGGVAWAALRSVPMDALPRLLDRLLALRPTHPGAVALGVGCLLFGVAACAGLPVNVCIAASVLLLPTWRGVAVALGGTLASAFTLHRLGACASRRQRLRWLRGRGALLRRLRGSVAAIALVRLLPLAPYWVVSALAGAVRAPLGRYLVGTALGMTPGILVQAVFLDRAQALLRSTHAAAAMAALLALLAMAVAWLLWRRWLRRRAMP